MMRRWSATGSRAADPGTPTHDALRLLATWAATHQPAAAGDTHPVTADLIADNATGTVRMGRSW